MNKKCSIRVPGTRFWHSSVLLGCSALLFPLGASAQSADSLRQEIQALRESYEARIADLERRLGEVESTAKENYDALDEVFSPAFMEEGLPKNVTRNFEFHGYLRAGFIFNDRGHSVLNAGEELIMPGGLFEIGWRLGNEADTYGEMTFVQNFPISEDGANFKFVSTLAFKYQGDKNNYTNAKADGVDVLFREAYIRADNVLPNNPDIAFWAGQRFYDRHDIHINDFYFLDMSGYGGGVENIPFFDIGNVDIAYIGGSQDDAIVNNNGPLTEHHIDVRLQEVEMLGGKTTFWLDLAYLKGEGASGGGNDNDFGVALGIVHFKTHNIAQGGFNKASVQYGFGPASDFNAYVLDWRSMDDIEDSETLRFTEQLVVQFSDKFSMMAAAVVEYEDLGPGTGANPDRWYASAGVRPIYMVSDYVALQGELGVDWVDRNHWDGSVEDSMLYKITFAPTIKAGGSFFARPEIRAFVTYGWWDNMPSWYTPGGLDSGDQKHVWLFGVQAETWW